MSTRNGSSINTWRHIAHYIKNYLLKKLDFNFNCWDLNNQTIFQVFTCILFDMLNNIKLRLELYYKTVLRILVTPLCKICIVLYENEIIYFYKSVCPFVGCMSSTVPSCTSPFAPSGSSRVGLRA